MALTNLHPFTVLPAVHQCPCGGTLYRLPRVTGPDGTAGLFDTY